MKKISEADLKKAIIAAETARAKQAATLRPDRAEQARLRKSRRTAEKMLSGVLKDAGLNVKTLRALHEERSLELERAVAKQKTAALKRASRALHPSIAEQSKALRNLAARNDFFPHPSFTLDKPFLIWTIPLTDISDSAIVPFGSWAKFKFSTSQYQGTQKVGFYFYWTNPYNDYAVINAATFLSVTGHLKAHAPWTFGVNTSTVNATALFNLWLGWPTSFISSTGASWFLANARAFGSTFTGGDTRGTSIADGLSLNTTMFAVPPGQLVIFEVALAFDWENDDGDIEADFNSGDFRIACPVVVFSLVNSPPVAVA